MVVSKLLPTLYGRFRPGRGQHWPCRPSANMMFFFQIVNYAYDVSTVEIIALNMKRRAAKSEKQASWRKAWCLITVQYKNHRFILFRSFFSIRDPFLTYSYCNIFFLSILGKAGSCCIFLLPYSCWLKIKILPAFSMQSSARRSTRALTERPARRRLSATVCTGHR